MGPGERNPDDRDRQGGSVDEMQDRQPPTREHQPDEVTEHAERSGADILLAGEAGARDGAVTERQECIESDIEGGTRPRQADNGEGHEEGADEPSGGHPQAAGEDPENIEEETQL